MDSRVCKSILEHAQKFELHQKGNVINSMISSCQRVSQEATLLTEVSKDFFCQEHLNDNKYYIVTPNAVFENMVNFMNHNGGDVKLILPKIYEGKVSDTAAMFIEDLDLEPTIPSIIDKVCLKNIRDILIWSKQQDQPLTRLEIVNKLDKYSKIDPSYTNYFLNLLTREGIISQKKIVIDKTSTEDEQVVFFVELVKPDVIHNLLMKR